MDRMEKSSHVGLVALAVSDMMYCIFHLSTILVPLKIVRSLSTCDLLLRAEII